MATTIRQVEEKPAAYPPAPTVSGQSLTPDDAAVLWQRLESYIVHRWTPRQVVWTVEGEGEWTPPLTPADVTSVEVWESGAWVATTPPAGPLGGYDFPGDGPYRVMATAGDTGVPVEEVKPPEDVLWAFRRLAAYCVSPARHANLLSATSVEEEERAGDGSTARLSYERPATWLGRAIVNSGAADLLRTYRRVP
ncbi:hypothetical protein [Tranquillimonas alkanivorans]|uniref:Uncharacterized protein n=1 Tax=Tranquillimonas alkanivorans TaxID=441119 RepID=A0A1I5PMZ8_9RHOB|nr:hypothetical protein [Tranquillimonas alkanivorans]SFP35160.1 hypothetical protein SAMN04488047_105168 [Tranquillimonas alkanivorans]